MVEGRARTVSTWLVALMISLAATLAAAATGEKNDGAPAGKSDAKPEAKAAVKAEAKPGAKAAVKAEAKPEAKGEAKPESKGDAKPKTETAKDEKKSDTKGDAKSDTKKDAKAEAADAKADTKKDAKAEAKSETKKDAKKETKTAEKVGSGKTAGSGKSKESAGAASEEPTGPITPPLKLNALREEMSRPPARHDEHAATKAEREKLEQLAAEINKAREGLRQDTAKLEAMLAARDAAPSPVASAGTPSSGDNGEPPKKVPSPLDNLSKAIRGMKPEQAAPIISRVDRKLAADILLRMPGADAGKVMGVCKPEVAAELAAEIASRTPHAELRR